MDQSCPPWFPAPLRFLCLLYFSALSTLEFWLSLQRPVSGEKGLHIHWNHRATSAFLFCLVKEIFNLDSFGSNFDSVEPSWSLHPFFVPLCLLGENEFNDLHGLTGLSRCSGELLWFRASFPAVHCFTSSWLSSDWTAAGWKDGRMKKPNRHVSPPHPPRPARALT